MTRMPRWAKMASASGVVGPLAASAISRAWTRSAFRAVIWPSVAAGTRMSQGTSSSLGDAERLRAGEADDGAGLLLVLGDGGDVEAALVVGAALAVADGDDAGALGGQQLGGDGASVAEALDGDASAAQRHLHIVRGHLEDGDDASGGGLVAPLAAADGERLAGDDGGDRVAACME